MIKYLSILVILASSFAAKAQTVSIVKHANTALNVKAIDVEPQFPGGAKAFYKYISKNVVFPEDVDPAQIQGIVTLTMAIEKDGHLSDIKIVKGISDVMDQETLRVIASAPNWKPGMQHGKPIRVRYTFNINYALIGKKK